MKKDIQTWPDSIASTKSTFRLPPCPPKKVGYDLVCQTKVLLHFRPTLPPPPFPGHWSGSDAPRVAPATAPVQTFKFTYVQLVPLGTFSLQSEDQVVLKIIPTLQKSVICLGKILNHIKWRRWLDKVVQLLFPFQLWFVCQHWKQLLPSKKLKVLHSFDPCLVMKCGNAKLGSASKNLLIENLTIWFKASVKICLRFDRLLMN